MSTQALTPSESSEKKPVRKRKKKLAKPAFVTPWWFWPLIVGVLLTIVTIILWAPRTREEPHVVRGRDLYFNHRFGEALGEFQAAPGTLPRYANVHLNRGLTQFRIAVPPGDGGLPMLGADAEVPASLQQARQELTTAAEGVNANGVENPDHALEARARYDLANTLFSTHSWTEAIEAYKAALRRQPGFLEAAWNLELARRMQEQEKHPDAGADASPPDSGNDGGRDGGGDSGGMDASNDGGDSGGNNGDASGDGSSNNGDASSDGGNNNGDASSDGGNNNRGDAASDSGNNRSDAGNDQDRDAGTPPPSGDAGLPPPDPRSIEALRQLERSMRSFQSEMLRRQMREMPNFNTDDR